MRVIPLFLSVLLIVVTLAVILSDRTQNAALAACDWSGDWDTQMGSFHDFVALTQDGVTVAGAYDRYGYVLGTAARDKLTGTWSFVDGRGWFELTMAADCQSFMGTLGIHNSTDGSPWTGHRIISDGPQPPPTVEELATDPEGAATGLRVPWSLEIGSDRDFWFTHQPCTLSHHQKGTVSVTVPGCIDVGDGVRGFTFDPGGRGNCTSYFYIVYTYRRPDGGLATRVSRFTFQCQGGTALVDERILIDNIPGGEFHTAGRLKFGPDGKLYLATGDALNPSLSQDPQSLAGKILRFNPDGSVPDDNPIPGSYVYSLGHRNPQGLAWHPVTGDLWITDHGPSPTIEGEPFRCCHDEINRIIPGGNYGWPLAAGMAGDQRFIDPALESGTSTWAPSGAIIYSGQRQQPALWKWKGSMLYGALIGQHLGRITFADPDFKTVASHEKLLEGVFGRIREVAQGPDGYIYFTTSNTDGRSGAQARPGDDRILRIVALPSLPERKALVRGVYQWTLGREPDPGGLDFWTYTHHTADALRDLFYTTPEGIRVAVTRKAYSRYLLRDPLFPHSGESGDVAGLRYWVDSALDLAGIEAGIASSEEAQRISTIRGWYVELFGRDPVQGDTSGLRLWVYGGLPLEQVREALLSSDEYRGRTAH